MHAAQERRGPSVEAVAREGGAAGAQREQQERRSRPEVSDDLAQGVVAVVADRALARPPPRLAHRAADDDRKHDPGGAGEDEREAPAQPLVHPAAHEVADGDPQRNAAAVDRERGGTVAQREVVGDHRVRRRTPGRLAHSHRDPRHCELEEVLRRSREPRHAPGGKTHGDDRAPCTAVSEAGDRDAGHGVEEREGETGEEAHRRVRRAQRRLDRVEQDDQDIAVEEVDRVDRDQDAEDVVAVPGARSVGRAGPTLFRGTRHGSTSARRRRGAARFSSSSGFSTTISPERREDLVVAQVRARSYRHVVAPILPSSAHFDRSTSSTPKLAKSPPIQRGDREAMGQGRGRDEAALDRHRTPGTRGRVFLPARPIGFALVEREPQAS